MIQQQELFPKPNIFNSILPLRDGVFEFIILTYHAQLSDKGVSSFAGTVHVSFCHRLRYSMQSPATGLL